MSSGPDHYREAERLIAAGEAVADEIRATRRNDEARRDALGKQAMGIWAQAQVHATLAAAAATGYVAARDWFAETTDAGCLQWAEVLAE